MKSIKHVKSKGKITNKEYQELNRISKPTATRELSRLVDLNILIKQGLVGKGIFYTLKTNGS